MPDPIRVTCYQCKTSFEASPEFQGKRVNCPNQGCGGSALVPVLDVDSFGLIKTSPERLDKPAFWKELETPRRRLKTWVKLYCATFVVGIFLVVILSMAGLDPSTFDSLISLVSVVWTGAILVTYIACMVYSFRIQASLFDAGLYPHGGWHVVVAGLIMNPAILIGPVYVSLSVLRIARRIESKK